MNKRIESIGTRCGLRKTIAIVTMVVISQSSLAEEQNNGFSSRTKFAQNKKFLVEPHEDAECYPMLRNLRRASNRVQSPGRIRLRQTQLALQAIWRTENPRVVDGVNQKLAEYGLTFSKCTSEITTSKQSPRASDQWWLLHEIEPMSFGYGATLIRAGANLKHGNTVVQIPHSYYDKGTLAFVREAMRIPGINVIMVNTVHRYRAKGVSDQDRDVHLADFAHQDASLYQALTQTIARLAPQSRFVQMHGYKNTKSAELILSAGLRHPEPSLRALLRRLKAKLESFANAKLSPCTFKTLLYPSQSRRLGGTQNTQARWLNPRGYRFLHVEMSSALREQSTASPGCRRKILEALVDAPTEGLKEGERLNTQSTESSAGRH